MKQTKLKIWILYFLILAKGSTVYWILTIQGSGGFSAEQCYGLISTITPLFSVYLTIVLKDITSNPYVQKNIADEQLISTTFRNLVFIALIIYWFIIIYIINMKPQGELSFEKMQAAIGGVETLFGVHLGYVFSAIFKKD